MHVFVTGLSCVLGPKCSVLAGTSIERDPFNKYYLTQDMQLNENQKGLMCNHVPCGRLCVTCFCRLFVADLVSTPLRRICRATANSSWRWDVGTSGQQMSTLAQTRTLGHRHG